jgi:mannose-6-phosphate isomerase-like protein (cupin superfamily)
MSEQEARMPPFPPDGLVNLTEAAGRLPWDQVDQALRLRARAAGAVLEICGLSHRAEEGPDDGHSDIIYVIISGYGVLRRGEAATEFTGGDLLFVPSGCQHRIERLDGEIRFWRLSLAPAPEAG